MERNERHRYTPGKTDRPLGANVRAGRFVRLSYRAQSRAGEPVRFEAVFRQDGPVTLDAW